MGQVVNDGSLVYKNADFDSPVITRLRRGGQYLISTQVFGPFYKIKVKDGLFGYIADTDIRPVLSAEEKQKLEEEARARLEAQKEARRKSVEEERYRGFTLAQINYREATMGFRPTDSMTFYGLKFSGPDLAAEGSYTDANLLFHFGAPKYYQEATSRAADGYAMILNFLYQIPSPQGKNTMLVYGFGPMVKYSKWSVALPNGTGEDPFELTDIAVGAVFNLGITHRFDHFALRGEFQFYWEDMQYTGLALAVQLPF